MVSEGGYQPGAVHEARSFLFRSLHPATVRKVLVWVGLSLWLGISLFFLLDFLGSDVRKLWKSQPVLKAAAFLVLLLLRRIAVWDAARRRRTKDEGERTPASHLPISPN